MAYIYLILEGLFTYTFVQIIGTGSLTESYFSNERIISSFVFSILLGVLQFQAAFSQRQEGVVSTKSSSLSKLLRRILTSSSESGPPCGKPVAVALIRLCVCFFATLWKSFSYLYFTRLKVELPFICLDKSEHYSF
jgi:hypothetical protein